MWSVANHTPFAAQGYFVRDQGGAEHWVIPVRASFAIRPDGLVGLAETQEPVLLAPRLRDSNGREMIQMGFSGAAAGLVLLALALSPGTAKPGGEVAMLTASSRNTGLRCAALLARADR